MKTKIKLRLRQSRWLTRLTVVYLFGLWGWFLLWVLTGESFWWMMPLNRAVPYLFVPALLLGLLAIWYRNGKALGMTTMSLLLFVWLYAPYLLPRLTPSQTKTKFSVMTFNVLYSNRHYDEVAEIIETYRPDVVALQEVQPEMMASLQHLLADSYPYSIMGSEHDYGTTAVLTIIRCWLNLAWDCKSQAATQSTLKRTKSEPRTN
ncbi:MAG: hypothetical protein GY796_07525 [Chloroflexi bacterium]|nr:hypothetical protein [Chloroflexota bacterium]